MDEIVPPPPYAEYPRDPKYRPMDEIGRLEVMAKAYFPYNLLVWLLAWVLNMTYSAPFSLGFCIFANVVNLLAVLALRVSLVRIYRVKGGAETFAQLFPFAVWVIGIVYSSRFVPAWAAGGAYLAGAFYGLYRGLMPVKEQFEKLGVAMPKVIMSSDDIDRMIRRLREDQIVEPALGFKGAVTPEFPG